MNATPTTSPKARIESRRMLGRVATSKGPTCYSSEGLLRGMFRVMERGANELSGPQQAGGDPAGEEHGEQGGEADFQIAPDPGQPAAVVNGDGTEPL